MDTLIRHLKKFGSLMVLTIAVANHAGVSNSVRGDDRPDNPKIMTESEVYKTIGNTALKATVYRTHAAKAGEQRAAAVFFFGGGWKSGNPDQFEPHARALAQRGMIAVTVDYRVANRHGVLPVSCVADARDAIRWLRANADRLGIDPQRIAAAGGSAGGHLAAATATLNETDTPDPTNPPDPKKPPTVSERPNALILFNPALMLAPLPELSVDGFASKATKEKLGASPENLSPVHHVKPGMPPTIIFHGEADDTVPIASVVLFQKRMKAAGNRCELIRYPNQKHGFFNANRNNNVHYQDTLKKTIAFLETLGYFKPTIAKKNQHPQL